MFSSYILVHQLISHWKISVYCNYPKYGTDKPEQIAGLDSLVGCASNW